MNKNKLTSCWALFSCFPFFWFRCSRSENAASTTSSSPVLAERCLFKLNFLLLELPGSFELVMFQDDTTLRGEVGDVVPFELDAWSSTKSLRKTLKTLKKMGKKVWKWVYTLGKQGWHSRGCSSLSNGPRFEPCGAWHHMRVEFLVDWFSCALSFFPGFCSISPSTKINF